MNQMRIHHNSDSGKHYFDLSQLAFDSTLADLPTFNFEVTPETLIETIVAEFEGQPSLLGAIVIDCSKVIGAFSRQTFLEQIEGSPTGDDLYQRPIKTILQAIISKPLQLPATSSVHTAVQIALDPPFASVYDPVVIEFSDGSFGLLNIHILLLAQSQLLTLANSKRKAMLDNVERKIQERTAELLKTYQYMERLDRAKADFVSVTSHELRTPITIIDGYVQLLQAEAYSDPTSRTAILLEGILNGTRRMYEIIEAMLFISKIDNQIIDLHKVDTSLTSLISNIQRDFETVLTERNITLIYHNLTDLPFIQADSKLLDRVFYQLIGNAIKYTPSGGRITVNGQLVDGNGEPSQVEIVVSDTGIGIDPGQLEIIFEKFYQLDEVALHSSSKTDFKGGGPGLGLAIARGIVLAHGGQIWAESAGCDEDNCPGSKFFVRLPLEG
jgi:signal transduction histidine kinase